MPTIHLTIKGKVQGVFYRASAVETAIYLGISGWVKNTPEGNVEILAQGNEEQLKQFIDWCQQGPPKAIVSEVIQSPVSDEEKLTGFKIQR